ncbi:Uncharacterised protein [Bacillus spizizenii]|nr:Uncharacterised protein [Bacillus spizizenii]
MPLTTAETIATMPMTETSGRACTAFSTCFLKNILTITPAMIGNNTACKIEIIKDPGETGSHSLANSIIKTGVKTGANKVEIVVTATERAVFPFAKNVMTLEAVPPGQQPTRITPTAISAGRCSPNERPKATSGMMVY